MKEETKKIFSGFEVGVLIEDFESQIKSVAEGVVSLEERLERVSSELKEHIHSEVTSIQIEIRELYERKADAIRLEALEKRVEALERLTGRN